jgi:hypothetical protein
MASRALKQAGLVVLDRGENAIRVLVLHDVTGGFPLAVQGVQGDDGTVSGQRVQQAA